MTRGKWSVRQNRDDRLRCQHRSGCIRTATAIVTWQSDTMPAPAFELWCETHFAEIYGGPRDGTRIPQEGPDAPRS